MFQTGRQALLPTSTLFTERQAAPPLRSLVFKSQFTPPQLLFYSPVYSRDLTPAAVNSRLVCPPRRLRTVIICNGLSYYPARALCLMAAPWPGSPLPRAPAVWDGGWVYTSLERWVGLHLLHVVRHRTQLDFVTVPSYGDGNDNMQVMSCGSWATVVSYELIGPSFQVTVMRWPVKGFALHTKCCEDYQFTHNARMDLMQYTLCMRCH